jgi:hypothetical protein
MDCTNINHLPTELLLEIGDYLSDDDDRACLALCSRQSLHKLGTLLLSAYKRRFSPEREVFLTRISRSTPSLVFCYDCSLLHSWAEFSTPYTLGPKGNPFFHFLRKEACSAQDVGWNHVWLLSFSSYYTFRYPHLQLAMRRHYLGPGYGLDLSMLSYIEVKDAFHDPHPFYGKDVLNLTSIDALITSHGDEGPDCLYLRVQECVHARDESVHSRDLLSQTKYVGICKHLWHMSLSDFKIGWPEDCDENTYPSPNRCFECLQCEVNFQIQVGRLQSYTTTQISFAITITRWYNLGTGHSPKEETWERHIITRALDRREFSYGTYCCFSRESGFIRQTFEEASGLSQRHLSLRNTRLLQDGAYRKWLTPRSLSPFDDKEKDFWDYGGDLSLSEVLCDT